MLRPVLFLMLAACSLTHADYCPPDSPASGGMRDIMLAYLQPGHWQEADFRPYVGYLDKSRGDVVTDWFYDSFLFLMFSGAPSGGAYYTGTANRDDWIFYLDLLFSAQHNLAALDACIEATGQKLGDPNHTCPVILMIPYLSPRLEHFGDVDGDGKDEDPSNDADRLKAFHWFLSQCMERWQAQSYRHLRLWGFYWMNEGIHDRETAVLNSVAGDVRAQGFGLHWIPWFKAPGYDRWRDLGLDFAIMQPNYAFMGLPRGLVVPDEDRLTQNANAAREHGLGVEMELDYSTDRDPGQRLELQLYLNHGVEELDGYMKDAVRAYYQTYDSIARLHASPLPECNRLYDDLYRFHKGTYRRRPVSLCEQARAVVGPTVRDRLTDGLWCTRPGFEDRVETLPGGSEVEVRLDGTQIVGDLRVHVVAREDASLKPPTSVQVFLRRGTGGYTFAGEVTCPRLPGIGGGSQAGFVILPLTPQRADWIKVVLKGALQDQVGVDEIVVMPAAHLLWGAGYALEGQSTANTTTSSGTELVDGRVANSPDSAGSVHFTTGSGKAVFDLDESWYLSSALAHYRLPIRKLDAAEEAMIRYRVTLEADAGTAQTTAWQSAAPGGDGWIELPLSRGEARRITFELSGPADLGWDELQVCRAPNLAQEKPYRLTQPFTSRYPDTDGRELTDGVLSQTGFGDGRTVGWYSQPVSVLLDLQREQRIDAIRLHMEGGGHAAVNYPDLVEARCSSDGETWQLMSLGPVQREVTYSATTTGEELNELAWLTLPAGGVSTRFLRLNLTGSGWIMISEIEAVSDGRNVARDCPYHLLPTPSSETKYADDGLRLTDGDYTREGGGWSKAVGWQSGEPGVIVDLLKPQQVRTVRVHCLGGGPGAVYFPPRLSVSTSLDGKEWTPEQITTEHPEEPGNKEKATFMSVQLPPTEARFVRVVAERKAWVMLDEIEVYGP
jgi:hypothetical protein